MNINFITAINKLSYGICGRNIVRALINQGHNPSLFPINKIGNEDYEESDIPFLQFSIGNAQVFDKNATCIRLWHQNDMAQMIGKGKHIGFPIFELELFKDIELHHLSSCDELFVCSHWAKQVCEHNKIHIPIHVIPLGVDSITFNPKPNQSDTFIIHNIGKIEIRKSHDLIPRIIQKAFRPDDKFKLRMMWRNPFTDVVLGEDKIKEWENYYTSILGDKVEFCPMVNTSVNVAEFINQSHLGLYISRAEGWNLSLLETMACGVNVIVTNYSGHTEYCNNENTHLINVSEFEPAYDGTFFNGFGNWAKVSNHVDEIAEKIRHIYELHKGGNLQQNTRGVETAKKFSWENTVLRIESCL